MPFGLPKNVSTPLAKRVLVPLGLTIASSTADWAVWKKTFGSVMKALITSNEEIEDIVKIVKSFKESDLLLKDVTEAIKNEAKEQKVDFSRCC